ncbi:MAG: ribosome recycling factor [Candidatus Vogelbacteria bacterium]|nr:ribosome recycling factor [Candidatus Vogelbacteria bacterium]
MPNDFKPIKNKTTEVANWLRIELSGVRTGRATPQLLDGVMVNAYGGRTPLKQLGALSVENGRTVRINVWDQNQLKEIESAIAAANLGVSVSADDAGLRIIFPELTAESRQKLIKVVRVKLEEAKVKVRQARDEVWSEIQIKERDGKISEDEKFRRKDELQKIINRGNEELDTIAAKKEMEILG